MRARLLERALKPIDLTTRGAVGAVRGLMVASAGGEEAAEAMRVRLEGLLGASSSLQGATLALEVESPAPPAAESVQSPRPAPTPRQKARPKQAQLSVQLVASTATGCLLSANRLCHVPIHEPAEAVEREARALLNSLEGLLASGACACEHTCDQLVVYMALAAGTSRLLAPRTSALTSQHLPTVIHFAGQMTGAAFRVTEQGACQLIECDGVAWAPP